MRKINRIWKTTKKEEEIKVCLCEKEEGKNINPIKQEEEEKFRAYLAKEKLPKFG